MLYDKKTNKENVPFLWELVLLGVIRKLAILSRLPISLSFLYHF